MPHGNEYLKTCFLHLLKDMLFLYIFQICPYIIFVTRVLATRAWCASTRAVWAGCERYAGCPAQDTSQLLAWTDTSGEICGVPSLGYFSVVGLDRYLRWDMRVAQLRILLSCWPGQIPRFHILLPPSCVARAGSFFPEPVWKSGSGLDEKEKSSCAVIYFFVGWVGYLHR